MPELPSKKKKKMEEADSHMLDKLSRNDLRRLAMNPENLKGEKKVSTEKRRVPSVTLMKLPASILSNIFKYCSIELYMRAISRDFSDFVVRHITTIRLHD